jgi:putative transposase
MRFRLVEAERAQHPVSLLCKVLGVATVGYYAWRRRGPSLRSLGDAELKRRIVSIYDGSLQTYGAPRIDAELADEHAVRVGGKRVARLMRALGIAGVSRRGKKRFKTTIPAKEALQRRSWCGASSGRPVRIGCGSPTSSTSRPGRATCSSPA